MSTHSFWGFGLSLFHPFSLVLNQEYNFCRCKMRNPQSGDLDQTQPRSLCSKCQEFGPMPSVW